MGSCDNQKVLPVKGRAFLFLDIFSKMCIIYGIHILLGWWFYLKLCGKFIELDEQRFFLSLPTDGMGILESNHRQTTKHPGKPGAETLWERIERGLILHQEYPEGVWSWCQEQADAKEYPINSRLVVKIGKVGNSTPHHHSYVEETTQYGVGWRPILIPIKGNEPDLLGFGSDHDGTVVRMYTPLLGGYPVRTNADDPEPYMAGSKIELTDRFYDKNALVNWFICNGIAIADRNLLSDISWNEIKEQGLLSDCIEMPWETLLLVAAISGNGIPLLQS